MEHYKHSLYYAKEGEFTTLDGKPYVGPYHVMVSGVLMSGNMHTKDSFPIIYTNNRRTERQSLNELTNPNDTLNENDTTYDLLPELINEPPVIIKAISEASIPPIKPSAAAGTLDGDYMYQFPDGSVKVHAGTSFELKVEATQPNVFNVENGVLEIKDSQEELTYRWALDGENLVADDFDESLKASRVISGSSLIITNMIPRYGGIYTCVVINDIGSSDAGSANIEVYNSDIDTLFYTNLVTNPNGRAEDNSLSTDGWESSLGTMQPKQLTHKTIGDRDKKINPDPMDQQFHWTKEMLFPRPYQLDKSVLQKDPIEKLNSYITREKYQYEVKGGSGIAQIYQDIDLTAMREQVRGSIYGVSGVTAIISFYLGMGIFNYEPAYPYLTPDKRADLNNYFAGQARLGVANYLLMGPGFVKERAYIDIMEFDNEKLLKTKYNQNRLPNGGIRILDPWNARLPNYANQVYFQGGANVNSSPGNNIDQHLFVADELFPTQDKRYTYGQYSEFTKLVIPALNPRTTKIRIAFTIESLGSLNFVLEEVATRGSLLSTDGIFESPGWAGSWTRNVFQNNPTSETTDPQDPRNPWEAVRLQYRTDKEWTENIEQRVPKQSLSRAFASGFNVSIVPNELATNNKRTIDGIYARNTRVEALVPSPVVESLEFDPNDTGERNLSIIFVMNMDSRTMSIQMLEGKLGESMNNYSQIDSFTPGLLPYDEGEITSYISPPAIKNLLAYTNATLLRNGVIPLSNATIVPPYTQAYPDTTFPEKRYVQLRNGQAVLGNGKTVPQWPRDWYTIEQNDRLSIYNDEVENLPSGLSYNYWAIPNKPLSLDNYIDSFNNDQSKAFKQLNSSLDETQTQWKKQSRFVITIGVQNSEVTGSVNGLTAIDNYYLDFIDNKAILHKTKNTANVEYLPSYDTFEKVDTTELDSMRNIGDGTDFNQFQIDPDAQTLPESVDIYKYDPAASQSMVPVELELSVDTVSVDRIASIEFPESFLKKSRLEGGLGIPPLEDSGSFQTTENVEIIQGSIDFAKTVDGGTPIELIQFNSNSAISASKNNLNQLLEGANALEKNFWENYNPELSLTDPKQRSILTDEDGEPILRVLPPEGSPYRTAEVQNAATRVIRLEQFYNQLLALREYSELSTILIGEAPVTATMYLTGLTTIDPKYKVVLYGVRPAPLGKGLTSALTQANNIYSGTPLSGQQPSRSRTYYLKDIKVANTGSRM